MCVYEIGLSAHVPEPSPADAAFLLSHALIIWGLLAVVRTPAGVLSRLRGAVEGLFMACGFVFCSWSLVIGSVSEQNGTLTFRGVVNLAYPLLDAVALAVVFFVALQRRLNPPAGLGLLACGIALLSVADSAWWYVNEVNANAPSVSPIQTGWVAGFVLIAFAALRCARALSTHTEQGRERRSTPTSVIPAEVILIRVGTLPRSSSLRNTDSPLDWIPDRSGSSNASARSELAI
jgi:hypothetical protein